MSCLISQYTRSSLPLAARLLCANRWLGLRNVTVHEMALADRTGVLPLFLNRFDETNSLLENAQGPGNPIEIGVYEHVGRIEVRVTTLDDWCAAELPTGDLVIKADMQGCEGRMLAGGCRMLGDGRVAALYSEVLFAPMYAGPGKLLGPARDAYDEARPRAVADLSTPPRSNRSSHLERCVVAARGCACIDAAVSDLHHAGLSAALGGCYPFSSGTI